MDQTHVHLILNHFPIILPIVVLFVIIAGLFFKSEILKRTAFCIFVVSAISAAIAFSSGEAAEHVVDKVPGVDEHFIEEHEEVAEVFIKLIYVLGVVSLLGLWANWKEKRFSCQESHFISLKKQEIRVGKSDILKLEVKFLITVPTEIMKLLTRITIINKSLCRFALTFIANVLASGIHLFNSSILR